MVRESLHKDYENNEIAFKELENKTKKNNEATEHTLSQIIRKFMRILTSI